MIERQFVKQKTKEFQIQEYISKQFSKAGHSKTEIQRTPLGEKVIVYATRPGLIVGSKGENIKKLTKVLKTRFKMENPQVEIGEVENPFFDPSVMAQRISSILEKYGPKRFKSVGYKTLQQIMDAGAIGAEIVIGGRGVPGARAKSWRFSAGHMKKSGDLAQYHVKKAQTTADLKSGTIGIKIMIMTPDIILPDKITVLDKPREIKTEEPKEEKKTKKKTQKKQAKKRVVKPKKITEKKQEQKEEKKEEHGTNKEN